MSGLIRLVSTSTIRPASGDRHGDFNRRIELTTSDVQYLGFNYAQVGLLFGEPKQSHHTHGNFVEHLKASLSQALDRLYPLAGRLLATQLDSDVKTASFSIACNGAGVTFVHAEALDRIAVTDILNPVVVPMEIVADLFPMTDVSNHLAAGSDLSLLAVQVTELSDGVFVGLSQNHCIGDGTTFWDFFNVWSELSRGDEAAIAQRPGFQFGREFANCPVRVPFCQAEFMARQVQQPPEVERRMLYFSKEKVLELKAKANAVEPRSSSTDREISSLQALIAHLWVCITRSRALPDGDEVSYMVGVDLRSRLQPPLPKSYAGNAVVNIVVTCTAGELLERGMGWAARQINKAISGQTAEEARKFFCERAKSCPSPRPLAVVPNMLLTGGSQWFDLYGNDFGWGRPLAMRGGPLFGPGKLIVSPGSAEGSLEFEATLLPETFRALASDPEFAQYSPYVA